jgi:phosphoribosylformylglycinamidine synthase I
MAKVRFGIVVFPGSNCDRDVAWVTRGLLGCPTRLIWHRETDLSGLDVVVLPGGFSYGDYLRAGALARFAPVMGSLAEHVARGGYVLGICNGFQILTEAGLLPGALLRNANLHFICDRVRIRVERPDLPWTSAYPPSRPCNPADCPWGRTLRLRGRHPEAAARWGSDCLPLRSRCPQRLGG